MGAIDKFFAGAFGLILVYLLVKNYKGVNAVLSGLGNFNAQTFSVLQGNSAGTGNLNLNVG